MSNVWVWGLRAPRGVYLGRHIIRVGGGLWGGEDPVATLCGSSLSRASKKNDTEMLKNNDFIKKIDPPKARVHKNP